MRNLIISLIFIFYSSISLSQLNLGLTNSFGYMFQDEIKNNIPSYKFGLTIEKNITSLFKINSNITYNRLAYNLYNLCYSPDLKITNEIFEIPLNIGVMLNTKKQFKNNFYLFTGYSFFYQFKSTGVNLFTKENEFISSTITYYSNLNLGLDYIRLIKSDYFCSIGILWQNGIRPIGFIVNDLYINFKFCKIFCFKDKNVIEK